MATHRFKIVFTVTKQVGKKQAKIIFSGTRRELAVASMVADQDQALKKKSEQKRKSKKKPAGTGKKKKFPRVTYEIISHRVYSHVEMGQKTPVC